jgi:hypothetical protein
LNPSFPSIQFKRFPDDILSYITCILDIHQSHVFWLSNYYTVLVEIFMWRKIGIWLKCGNNNHHAKNCLIYVFNFLLLLYTWLISWGVNFMIVLQTIHVAVNFVRGKCYDFFTNHSCGVNFVRGKFYDCFTNHSCGTPHEINHVYSNNKI